MMYTHTIVKIGFIPTALVLGASTLESSDLETNGYLISCGRTGCTPGGSADCDFERI